MKLSAISYQLSANLKNIFFCLLSALLLSLSFSFSYCWILAWFAFVPLLMALDSQSARKAFFLSYLSGLAFWAGTIYWLVHITLFGQIILLLYLALYFGIFGLLLSFVFSLRPPVFLLFAPSLWVILEYLRGHLLTGFPWALLGYSQYANLPVIQIADIGGVWLVSFLVMLVNAAVFSVFRFPFSVFRPKFKYLLLFLICLGLTLAYGYYRLCQGALEGEDALKISVIQGNIPQKLKWEAGSREFVMERYLKLTGQAVKEGPDLVIWPEASLPVILEDEPLYYERLSRYAGEISTPLLFGAVTVRGNLYYNSALLLSGEGQLSARYDKLHLVPFGEYIPFRRLFPFLETIAPIGDIARGSNYTLFNLRHNDSNASAAETGRQLKFGVLICFEDVFPELSRRFVNRGADYLVNITNDAWFGKTSEAYQHLAASVFRAVENRVNLVRSANTGVSGFISPRGKIISLVSDGRGESIFVPGYRTQEISLLRQPTFYGHYGDFWVILCLACVLYALFLRITEVKGQK